MKRVNIPIILALLFCGLSWSFASPIGSSSDDNFHLASIWCSHGLRLGRCEESVLTGYRRLPTPIANAGRCYLGDEEKSASCTNDEILRPRAQMTPTNRFATDSIIHGQQSFFYWTNGFFVSRNIEVSVLLMRFFNSVLLLSLLLLAAKSRSIEYNVRLRIVLLSVAIPVFLWTINSNSSSSWTFLGSAFFWFFLDALLTKMHRPQNTFALVGLLVSVFLCLGSRSEAAPFLLIQLAVFIGLRVRSRDWMIQNRRIVLMAAAAFITLGILFFFTRTWVFFTDAFGYVQDETPIVRPGSWVLLYNLQSIPILYYWLISAIGVLNAADFAMTGTVGILTSIVLTLVLIESLKRASRRSQIILLLICLTAVVVPILMLQSNKLLVGEELLPRYFFPLFVLAIGFCVFQSPRTLNFGRGQSLFVASCLSVAHLIVLRQVILRHVVGIEQFGLFDLDRNREWWWMINAAPSPMTVWLVGSVSFSFLAFSTFSESTRSGVWQVNDVSKRD
jgi:Predicted membrane protein (DUF2142)